MYQAIQDIGETVLTHVIYGVLLLIAGTAANLVRETEKNKNYSEILMERGDAYAERTHLMPPPKENSLNL